MCLNLCDALYCIDFLRWLLEINVNIFDILCSVNYLSRKDEGGRRISLKTYFHLNCIRVWFVSRFSKTFPLVLHILHVDTRGSGSISCAVKFHCDSTANQMSFKL